VILNQIRTKIGVMYGDPMTTPGGKAIPFHSSIRLKLGAGQKIENKNKEVIGIHVSAKTIKNKVSAPFRTCKFEIHFGVGIKEHEQIFDELRKHGKQVINGKEICVSGTGSWKTLLVIDSETGEVLVEKKFFKSDFDQLIENPKFSPYIDALLAEVMIKKLSNDNEMSVDLESYEEVRSISLELEEDLISPEG